MNSDKPFELRGGDSKQTAIYNRIACLERIKFLTKVDLAKKPAGYLRALEMEMWKRWLKDEPQDKRIDEEFCQRTAVVVATMEEDVTLPEDHPGYTEARGNHHKQLLEIKDANKSTQSDNEDAGRSGGEGEGGVREGSPDGNDHPPGGGEKEKSSSEGNEPEPTPDCT